MLKEEIAVEPTAFYVLEGCSTSTPLSGIFTIIHKF
jgi:hypothetical protein